MRQHAPARSLVVAASLVVLLCATPIARFEEEALAQVPLLPNVLIILTDDQRTDTLGVMPATKRLFGSEGTKFRRAHAVTPLCCPSRASIFSGRYAHNHRVRNNAEAGEFDERSGIQRYLQERGYHTAIFGKYLLGRPLKADPAHFNEWATFLKSPISYRNGEWNVDGTVETVRRYSTRYLANRAVQFVDERESVDVQPWMMMLSTAAPHAPFIPDHRYASAPVSRFGASPSVRERVLTDKPPFQELGDSTVGHASRVRTKQLRTLMSVDDMVKRVFAALEDAGEQNTLAFFLSDNGYLWGEHGLMSKRYPYPASVRIPLMMRWPDQVSAGAVDDRLVATIDVAPTIMEAALVQPDAEYPIDGRSLLGDHSRQRLLLEFRKELGLWTWASTITRAYQYTEYYEGGSTLFREYYDLRADPWQLQNRFGDANRSNDPSSRGLVDQLKQDRGCAGAECP